MFPFDDIIMYDFIQENALEVKVWNVATISSFLFVCQSQYPERL